MEDNRPRISQQQRQRSAHGAVMEQVLGIGGFFFRSHDPERLGLWYEEMLGVPRPPATYEDPDW